jgi:hypothetical protein
MVSKLQLKRERGWSDSLLIRFLPDRDALGRCPVTGRNGAALFRLDRVEEIEASEEFKRAVARHKAGRRHDVNARHKVTTARRSAETASPFELC